MRYVVAGLLLIVMFATACDQEERLATGPGPGAAGLAKIEERDDQSLARTVVDAFLAAPASAQYRDVAIVERGPNGWRYATVEVDAQNAFGVPLRKRYHVVFRRVDATHVEWTKLLAVQEIGPFDNQSNIDAMKTQNGWPQPAKPKP